MGKVDLPNCRAATTKPGIGQLADGTPTAMAKVDVNKSQREAAAASDRVKSQLEPTIAPQRPTRQSD